MADPAKGKALTPQLAPVFSPEAENSSILLQPARAITLAPSSASATSTPAINCRLKVSRIGTLDLGDAEVVIVNNSVEVRPGPTALDPAPYLRGTVLKVDRSGTASGAGREMSGLVLFQSGDRIAQLNDQDFAHADPTQPPASELIFRKSGSISGRITGVRAGALTVQTAGRSTDVPLDSVAYVRSPRAFVFTISGRPSADNTRTRVDSISFRPTTNTAARDQLVVGKPRDPLDLDDDDLPLRTPENIARVRQHLDSGGFSGVPGGRPFPSWP
jgi:hypothetical protein